MSTKDTKVDILWLSDIHYDKSYIEKNKNETLKKYIKDFIVYCEELSKHTKYEYILISGDLAQQGHEDEYHILKEDILSPLYEIFPKSTVLTIPGNHDLNRELEINKKEQFSHKFIENLSEKGPKENTRDFFKNNRPHFDAIFESYSKAMDELPWELPQNSTLKKNKFLFGTVVDIPNRVLFVLLNSSWYSMGDEILREYLKNILLKKDAEDNPAKKDAEDDLIKKTSKIIRGIAEEYGNQILGLDQIEEIKEILKEIEKYRDFVIITTMHHPINWLDMKDRITTQESNFYKIRENTDLLLTGHEHVTKEHYGELINDGNIYHIQGGCFMWKQNPEKFKTWKNWFSTLEINTRKRNIKQHKHYYDDQNQTWVEEKNGISKWNKLNKKYVIKRLSDERLQEIKQKINSEIIRKEIIKRHYKNSFKKDLTVTTVTLTNSYYLINNTLYIFEINMFDNQSFKDIVVTLKEYIDRYSIKRICFLFFDVYNKIYDERYGNDITTIDDRLEVLGVIKNDYDTRFDHFRYQFFSSLTLNEANKYNNIVFVSVIKPFWEIESYT